MCGIAGIIAKEQSSIRRMVDVLSHRGTSSGFYEDENCALGHRRLSIIDLSDAANQPMFSSCGRYVITFNGEIYNYLEIADELDAHNIPIFTDSDTEVLLASYVLWGEAFLSKLRGMFAFAIWDIQEKKLFAARDHLGVKPFYWSFKSGEFVFASEIKAFSHPRHLNKNALYKYLAFGSINPPDTILENVYSLMPGHTLKFDGKSVEINPYWDMSKIKTISWDGRDVHSRVQDELYEAVAMQMRSDVSVGAFLSGGLDSSTIVGLMSRLTQKPIETFSIGFGPEGDYVNELSLAKLAANKFNTNHHEVIVSGADFKNEFNNFIASIDQPSSDGINSYLVSKVASNYVKVALSGVGGDELFLGYRYFEDLARMQALKSNFVGKNLMSSLAKLSTTNPYFKSIAWRSKLGLIEHFPSEREKLYLKSRMRFDTDAHNSNLKTIFDSETDYLNAFSKLELSWYTPGTLLRDTDATSMAHTLEVRVPLLDINLVELMLSIPSMYKVKKRYNKPLLIDESLLPRELLEAPKKGFEMPVGYWLCDHFSQELEDLIDTKWLNNDIVLELVSNLYKNPKDYIKVWTLLVLKHWIKFYDIEEDSLHSPWSGTRGSASKFTVLS